MKNKSEWFSKHQIYLAIETLFRQAKEARLVPTSSIIIPRSHICVFFLPGQPLSPLLAAANLPLCTTSHSIARLLVLSRLSSQLGCSTRAHKLDSRLRDEGGNRYLKAGQ
jgi:hypothetical protein